MLREFRYCRFGYGVGRSDRCIVQTFPLHAWTGGDRPSLKSPHGGLGTPWQGAYLHIRGMLYREQLSDFHAFWGDLPDCNTRQVFWIRASYDAYRTITEYREGR